MGKKVLRIQLKLNKRYLLTLVSVSFFSCANISTNKGPESKFQSEFRENQLSLETYLSLVKQSYTKGCINGMNYVSRKKTSGKRLDFCMDFADKHIIGLKKILKND